MELLMVFGFTSRNENNPKIFGITNNFIFLCKVFT